MLYVILGCSEIGKHRHFKDIEKYNESVSDFEMFIEPQKDLLVFNKLAYPLLALLIKGLVLGVIFLFTHKEC